MSQGLTRKGFDLDLRTGEAAENRLLDIIQSGNGLVEVKSDKQAQRTGNIFVEVEYRGQPSGLSTTEAEFWAYEVDDDVFVLMRVDRLRKLASVRRRLPGGDHDMSVGVLLPLTKLVGGPNA